MNTFQGKVGLIQRVLPHYRKPFFNALGKACTDGLCVFSGEPRPEESIKPVVELEHALLTLGKNRHIFGGRFYMVFQLGLIKWIKTCDPDVLIVEANPRYLSTLRAIRWMRNKDRPVIGWGLGSPDITDLLASLRLQRRKNFIQHFDTLITYSQTGASQYAKLGFPKERIFVAANAVAPSPPHPMPDRRAPEEVQQVQILFVGRLQERKKLDNLIYACSQLPKALQPDLVIVGDGPDRLRLTKIAEKVYPGTIFTGALYGENLAKQFRQADLFVLPGTGGLAIQQAMSYGLPVIAAQADGTQADLIREGNGWQIPVDDITALRSTLEKALVDKAALREMGAESYRIVSEEINIDKMVQVFIEALNRSLS
jgi:glycosyltransferase involved in cell wall biosynthesis